MKQKETSKTVLACVLVFCGAWLIAVLVGWFMGREDAAALAAVPSTVCAAAVGFYSWKAKAENVIKIAKGIDKDAEREVLNTMAQQPTEGRTNDYYGY